MKAHRILLWVLTVITAAWSQEIPAARKLSDIRLRDPFILADSETQTYFLYAQMSKRVGSDVHRGVEVYTSKDLETWKGPTSVFQVPPDFWAHRAVWAPEVHHFEGMYYLMVTFTADDTLLPQSDQPTLNKRGTQILKADSPHGPFQPFHNRSHTPLEWSALDGTLIVEGGQPYMVFCHEWLQVVDGTVECVRLKKDLSEQDGTPQTLFRASEAAWVKNLKDLGSKYRGQLMDGYVTDGPFLFRTKTGRLLMIWSSFGMKGYALGIAVSVTGKVAGPWRQVPAPLFASDGGHGMIFRTFDGRWMLTLHQPNKSPDERARLFELVDTGEGLSFKE